MMHDSVDDLDPRYNWVEVRAWGDRLPRYVRGSCLHLERIDVESLSGERVAQLCLTCDTQLPARFVGPTLPNPRRRTRAS